MGVNAARVQAVLFDIDGTLSDTDDQMVARLADFLKFLFFLRAQMRLRLARWIVMALESPGNFIYNLADRFELDAWFVRVIDWWGRRRVQRVRIYHLIPGARELLEALRPHYRLGIVSARDERSALAFVHQFALSAYFGVIVTSQTTPHTKPFPDPLLHAAHALGVEPGACLMVGDTPVDITAAKRAGMQAVGLLCGYGTQRELLRVGSDLILSSLSELKGILTRV